MASLRSILSKGGQYLELKVGVGYMVNGYNFVYVLMLIKPEALHDLTAEGEATVDEHFGYLKHALVEGRLGFAGRCPDGQFGIALFARGRRLFKK